jgi:hypothetical protein
VRQTFFLFKYIHQYSLPTGRDDFREVKNADFSSFVYFLGMAKVRFPL